MPFYPDVRLSLIIMLLRSVSFFPSCGVSLLSKPKRRMNFSASARFVFSQDDAITVESFVSSGYCAIAVTNNLVATPLCLNSFATAR